MTNDDLDRILSEEEILPSSGFAGAVMDAVRREASAPPPIPFPWKRVWPGLGIAGLTVLWALISLARLVVQAAMDQTMGSDSILQAPLLRSSMNTTGWVTLALIATLAAVRFSMRLGSRRT